MNVIPGSRGKKTLQLTLIGTVVFYLTFSCLLFWPLPVHLSSMVAGDNGTSDWNAVRHVFWMVRSHWDCPAALVHTDLLYYPAGVPFLARVGNFLDLVFIGFWQEFAGTRVGYNIAAILLITILGCAVHRCARKSGATGWTPFVAGIVVVSSGPVATEIANGRFFNITALIFSSLFFAELPDFARGNRRAAIRAGLWMALVGLAHWYSAVLVSLFVVAPLAWLMVKSAGDARRVLLHSLAFAAMTCSVVIAGPVLFQMAHISAISGVEGSFLEEMLLPVGPRLTHAIQNAAGRSISPWEILRFGVIPLSVVFFAVVSLIRGRRQTVLFWGAVLVGSMVIVWGPLARTSTEMGGGDVSGIPLPSLLLFRYVPFFWRLIWIDRVALFTCLAAAILAANGVTILAGTITGRPRLKILLVLVALFLPVGEAYLHRHIPFSTSRAYRFRGPPEETAVRYLESLSECRNGGAVISYPAAREHCSMGTFFQSIHQRPMLNGFKGLRREIMPEEFIKLVLPNELVEALSHPPHENGSDIPQMDIARLRMLGFSEILIHLDLLPMSAKEFRQSPLGKRLERGLGPSENYGCLLVYLLGGDLPPVVRGYNEPGVWK